MNGSYFTSEDSKSGHTEKAGGRLKIPALKKYGNVWQMVLISMERPALDGIFFSCTGHCCGFLRSALVKPCIILIRLPIENMPQIDRQQLQS